MTCIMYGVWYTEKVRDNLTIVAFVRWFNFITQGINSIMVDFSTVILE